MYEYEFVGLEEGWKLWPNKVPIKSEEWFAFEMGEEFCESRQNITKSHEVPKHWLN